MIPASPNEASGHRGLSANSATSSLSDWQEKLLEAIEQRDAHRAVTLAQRCVHRYGMHTLVTLLERANAAGADGQDSEARAWLLPLLGQPFPALEPSVTQSSPEVTESTAPQPILPPDRDHPPSTEPDPTPSRASLDEAFAPLEIAFPPLTTVFEEPIQSFDNPAPPAWVPPPASAGVEVGAFGLAVPFDQAAPADSLDSGDPVPDETAEPPDDENDVAPIEVPIEEGEAAPVPTFELDAPSTRQPTSRKMRSPDRGGSTRPAPISPALEPWLVWLPGAFRSRSRP